MSTTANSTSAPAAPSQAPSRPAAGHSAAQKAGGSCPADVFASLLGLLSATDGADTTALGADPATDWLNPTDALGDDPKSRKKGGAAANPLADLIGWAGAPSAADPASALGAADGSAALGLASDPNAAAALAAQGEPGKAGVSLQGMTVLDQPELADAQLLGKLQGARADAASPDAANVEFGSGAQDAPAGPTTHRLGDNPATARTAQWRSTATLGASSTTAANSATPSSTAAIQSAQAGQTAQLGQGTAATLSARGAQGAGAIASDAPRFAEGLRSGPAAAIDIGATAFKRQDSGAQGEGPSGRGEATFAGLSGPDRSEASDTDTAFSLDPNALADDEGQPSEHLSAHALRHAQVRVGEGTAEALDVRLSLQGDAIQVDFRTDNAELRAGLQHNAGATLSEMLERSGIQLGGMSVGGQSQASSGQAGQQGQAQPNAIGGARSGVRALGADAANTAVAQPPSPRRAPGSNALDVFA